MAEQQIILKKRRLPFTQVPNNLLCNSEISGLAKSLWCLLYSKPDEWTFYWTEILKHFKEGRDAVKKAGKELEKFGYMKKVQKKRNMNGKMVFGGMEIELDYEPATPSQQNQVSIPITEIQSTENQLTEDPSTEDQSTNKDLSNKDLSNKDLSNLSTKRKKEKLKIPNLEEIKKIFVEKSLKSDPEKYFLHRQKSNWTGVKNLDADIFWWENGHKEKFPHLHEEQNEEKTKNKLHNKSLEEIKYEEEIKEIQSQIKFAINHSSDDGYLIYHKYFDNKLITKTSEGYIIFVSDKEAFNFTELLNEIDVQIKEE